MLALIETLKSALQSESTLPLALEKYSELSWQAEYPVAVVHEARRVKEDGLVDLLKKKNFLNESGFSPARWDLQNLDEMRKLAPKYLKQVSMLVHTGKAHQTFKFQEKREKDYWKKIVDYGSLVAAVEQSQYDKDAEICQIESDLRDVMRSSKEIPALKEIGFIWMVEAPMTVEMDRVLAHYYGKNWMMVIAKQKTVYIGWHERLGSVDMRHFVCPPNMK